MGDRTVLCLLGMTNINPITEDANKFTQMLKPITRVTKVKLGAGELADGVIEKLNMEQMEEVEEMLTQDDIIKLQRLGYSVSLSIPQQLEMALGDGESRIDGEEKNVEYN